MGSTLLPTPTGYVALWEEQQVAVEIHQPRHIPAGAMGGWWADITVVSKMPAAEGCLHEGRVNMSSLSAKVALTKYLRDERWANIDWDQVLSQTFRDVIRLLRVGQPSVNLASDKPRPAIVYAVEKLAQEGQFTIIYGEKDSGKSLLALAVAYALTDGNEAMLDLCIRPCGTWYLDWETDEETQGQRLQWLAKGMGAFEVPPIRYRQMDRPLADCTDALRSEIAGTSPAVIIVDSLGFACGGTLKEEEAARQFLAAVRSLGTTVLAIGQTRKSQPGERRKQFSVYGSTFFEYAARSIWRVQARREMDEPSFDIGVYHEKANNSRRFQPLGYRIEVDERGEAIYFKPQDVRKVPELAEGGKTLSEGIMSLLLEHTRTVQELAESLDTSVATVRVRLQRLGTKVRKVGHVGREPIWGADSEGR